MPPILVPSSAKPILVNAKLNGRKDFILRGFVSHIIPSLLGTTCSKLATEAQK